MQANSNVRVSIGASLSGEFGKAFTEADKRMAGLGKTAAELSKKVNDVQGFRRQQNAVKAAGAAWQDARAKAAGLRAEIEKSGAPTKRQEAELRRADTTARRLAGAYTQARTKLADMSREIQRSGTNVTRLSSEYRRLQTELTRTNGRQREMEASLRRQQAMTRTIAATWRGVGTTMRGVGQGVAGITAAGAILSRPMAKGMSYDEQLTYMADTAGGGRTAAEKQVIRVELSDAINAALKAGGGKREDAATALNTLIASGKFGDKEAQQVLPSVTKTAFAAGASAEDIAKTAISMKQFGVTDIAGGFDRMLRAGQLGNFELKDMARWLPQQMAAGRASGLSGMGGLSELLAFNQTAMRTAGTQDEAGNNVVNLLTKFTSREMQESMSNAVTPKKGDPVKKGKKGKREFDWQGFMMRNSANGISSIDSFGTLLERQLAGDKRYQAITKSIANAKTPEERKAGLESAASIAEGSKIGEIIADRQALMAALAALYGKDEMTGLRGKLKDPGAAVDQSSEFVRAQTWSKAQDTSNTIDRANEKAYDALSGPFGRLLEASNGLAERFPGLTTAAYAAGTALTAIAGLGIAGGAAGWAMRGGSAAVATGTAAAGAAGAAATGTTAAGAAAPAAAGIWGKLALGARFAGPLAMLAGVANMTTSEEDEEIMTGKARFAAMREKHGQGTIDEAREKYQPWYQVGKGYAADNEKWVAQLLAEREQASSFAADSAKAAAEAATAAQNKPNLTFSSSYSISITPQVGADGKIDMSEVGAYLRRMDREREAEARSSMMGDPGH